MIELSHTSSSKTLMETHGMLVVVVVMVVTVVVVGQNPQVRSQLPASTHEGHNSEEHRLREPFTADWQYCSLFLFAHACCTLVARAGP